MQNITSLLLSEKGRHFLRNIVVSLKIIMILWCCSPLRSQAFQPVSGLTSICQQRQVKDHPVGLNIVCDRQVKSPSRRSISRPGLTLKLVGSYFLMMMNWHRSHTLAKNSATEDRTSAASHSKISELNTVHCVKTSR